jgi:hypothetical protein
VFVTRGQPADAAKVLNMWTIERASVPLADVMNASAPGRLACMQALPLMPR